MTDQNTNRTLRDRILVVDEARYLLNSENPQSLNVAKDFGVAEVRDFVMDLFEQMAGRKLTPGQRELAVETGLQLAEGETHSLGTLIKAWMSEPNLRDFAAALLYAAFPGSRTESQSIEGLTIDRSGPNAVIAFHGQAL